MNFHKEKPIPFSAWKMGRVLAMPGEGITEMATLRPMKPQPPSTPDGPESAYPFARYQPGDILWPREPWRTASLLDDLKPSELHDLAAIWYVAGGGIRQEGRRWTGKLRAGMFLPYRFARPNRYEVLRVEVRRPRELTDKEIIAEGIRYQEGWFYKAWYGAWVKAYGRNSWFDNPWSWRITFREVRQELP